MFSSNPPPVYTPTPPMTTGAPALPKLIPESVVASVLQKYNIPNHGSIINEMLSCQATSYAQTLSTTIWFGKYKNTGKTFADIALTDPQYLKKMVTMRDENGQNWLQVKAPDQYEEILNLLYMKN